MCFCKLAKSGLELYQLVVKSTTLVNMIEIANLLFRSSGDSFRSRWETQNPI